MGHDATEDKEDGNPRIVDYIVLLIIYISLAILVVVVMIPIIRINYSIKQLFFSLFVSENSDKYRNKLKKLLCDYFDTNYVVLTSSGRTAIYMLVKTLPQKKVIIPAYTCEVVEEAVRLAGKQILYAHVSKNTLNISEYPAIDSDTIVIATHQYGLPSEMKQIAEVCKEKKAVLIEDCAGSLGSKIRNKLTGTFGDFGVYSFSASKTLHSPTKGGFIIAKDENLLISIENKFLFDKDSFSFKVKQIVKGLGFCLNNYSLFCSLIKKTVRKKDTHPSSLEKIDKSTYRRGFYEWQAFVVIKQFENLTNIFEKRKEMASKYENGIKNNLISKPVFCEDAVNIRYALLVKERSSFINYCISKGIQVGKGYKRSICPDDYVEERELSNEIVYLPFGNKYSKREIQYIISTINEYC